MPPVSANDTWLSWKHKRSQFRGPVSLAEKIELFYERIVGWQLEIADQCVNGSRDREGIPHSAFAGLQICLSYFETIGKYEAGCCKKGESEKHFKLGLKSVFPYLRRIPEERFDRLAARVYSAARCGLYHASQTGPGVLLRRQRSVLRFDAPRGVVFIDPHRLPVTLKAHLCAYRRRLERARSKRLRTNFEERFDFDNSELA